MWYETGMNLMGYRIGIPNRAIHTKSPSIRAVLLHSSFQLHNRIRYKQLMRRTFSGIRATKGNTIPKTSRCGRMRMDIHG